VGLRVRIPPGAWMSVSYECCVLSGRGLCDGLINCPEESFYSDWAMWLAPGCAVMELLIIENSWKFFNIRTIGFT